MSSDRGYYDTRLPFLHFQVYFTCWQGGMKAVLWTDLIQSFMMFIGVVGLFMATAISVGGFDELVKSVQRGGRNNFLK